MRLLNRPLLAAAATLIALGCGNADPLWSPDDALYAEDDNNRDTLSGTGDGLGGCDGACEYQIYSTCTCGPDDPCGWSGDGYCDAACYLITGEERFDDGDDCTGVCGGLCEFQIYSPCTCGEDDPCGWQEDGACDALCLTVDGLVTMFDDGADCTGTCDGHCDVGLHSACTCGPDDPCGWQEDGICDDPCLALDGVDEVFDDSVDCAYTSAE